MFHTHTPLQDDDNDADVCVCVCPPTNKILLEVLRSDQMLCTYNYNSII